MASPGAASSNVLFAPFDVLRYGSSGLGSWRTGEFAPERMFTDILGDFSRSTDVSPASTRLAVVLPKPVLTQCAAMIGHTCTTDAMIRVTGYADVDLTETVDGADTGWVDVFPPYTIPEALPPEHPNWMTGRLTEEEMERLPRVWFHVFDRPKFVHAWLYEFDDRYNPNGVLDIGRLWQSPAFQPELNFTVADASDGWQDEGSQTVRSAGGTVFSREEAVYRAASFTLAHLKKQEAFYMVSQMQQRLGRTRPFLLSLYPRDLQYRQRYTWFALFRTLMSMKPTDTGRYSQSFEVWEQM